MIFAAAFPYFATAAARTLAIACACATIAFASFVCAAPRTSSTERSVCASPACSATDSVFNAACGVD